MATAQEVGALVIRLQGDATDYQRTLKDAERETKQAAGSLEGLASELTGLPLTTAALGAGFLALGKMAFDAFSEAEAISIRLSAILQANRRDVEGLTARYEAFAQQMERTTTLEDDFVKSLLATAEGFGLTADKAEEAVQNAAALAAIMGGTAEQYLRFTAAMAQGDFELARSMGRLLPQLRGVKNEYELVTRAQALFEAGQIALQRETETTAGKFKMLKRDLLNALEPVGGLIADFARPQLEVLNFMAEKLKEGTERLNKLREEGAVPKGLRPEERGALAVFDLFTGKAEQGAAAAAGFTRGFEGLSRMSFDARASLEKLTKQLDLQAATWRMTADEAERYKFIVEGATEAELSALKSLQEIRAAQKREDALTETRHKAIGAAFKEGAQAFKELDKVREEIVGKDPLRHYQAQMERYQAALRAGRITEEEYALGVRHLNEELARSTKHTDHATQAMTKYEAVLADSAEAIRRVEAMREHFRPDERRGLVPAFAGGAFATGGLPGVAGAAGGGAPAAGATTGEKLLTEIRDILRKQAGIPPVILQPAGFQ